MYRRYGKRLIDATLSLMALLVLCPFLLIVGILVKWTSPGPMLYWQERVGRDGQIFKIAKFRSMIANADKQGLGITVSGDARVTGFGAFLRRSKIDELPQLWNVLIWKHELRGSPPGIATVCCKLYAGAAAGAVGSAGDYRLGIDPLPARRVNFGS